MVIRTWTGIEGFMPDSIPVIGMSEKIPELVHAFGFSGHGQLPLKIEIRCNILKSFDKVFFF